MSLCKWSKDYVVDNGVIDQQHQRLFELINQLYEAMRVGKAKDVMTEIIAELVDYTKTHFQDEERLMISTQYSDFFDHKAQHDDFILKVAEFQAAYTQDKLGVDIDILNFLNNWLIDHICQRDKKINLPSSI